MRRVPSITAGNDDAAYVLLARALRAGGYHSIWLAGTPLHVQYPPLWPALLAMVGGAAGERVSAFVALSIALSAASLLLVFDAVRRICSAQLALLALAVAALLPVYVISAGRVMSEAPFAAFTALTLWALARRPLGARMLALAIAAAVAAALTRTVGVTLLIAVVLHLALLGRRRAAAALALVLAAAGAALVLAVRAHAGMMVAAPYLADAGTGTAGASAAGIVLALAGRLVRNSAAYVAVLLPSSLAVPTVGGTRLDNLAWVAVLVTCWGAGLVVLWRRWRALVLVLATMGALLALWAWPLQRFTVPLLPEIVALTLVGAAAVARRAGTRAARLAPAVLALILVAGSAPQLRSTVRSVSTCDRVAPTTSSGCYNGDQRDFFAAARLAGRVVPAATVVLTSKPAAFYYYAGRRAIADAPRRAAPAERVRTELAGRRVGYVLLSRVIPAADRARARWLQPACGGLELVRAFSAGTALLRVSPSGIAPDRPAACAVLTRYLALPGTTAAQKF